MLWIYEIVGGLIGFLGLLGTLTFFGFLPVLAPIFGAIVSVFFKIIGALLSTRIGVACLTAVVVTAVVFPIADIRGRHDIKMEWAAADAAAAKAASARDARIAAEATATAQVENESLKRTSDELSTKVAEYETELAKRPANASCVLGADDVRRLRDISGQGKPKSASPNLNSLRAIGGKGAPAGH